MSTPAKLRMLRLNSPDVQNVVAGLVLALAPGMFTALASLGAGGSQASNTKVSSTVSAVLYAIYTLTGWFASLMLNTVGPRWTMALGAVGYPTYGAAFWYFDRTGNAWFPYLSAVVLGVSAGWLWTTSGYCITAYSTESTRGKFIAVQGVLSAMGSMVGAALTLGIVAELPSSAQGTSVPTAVYACFTALMICSPFVAGFFLIDPSKILRSDGTKIAEFRNTSNTTVKREFLDAISMCKDWKLMLMLPVFFASDVATVSPSMSAYAFDLKARTLLAFVTTLAAIPTVLCLWPLLDNPRWPRKVRGLCAISFLGLLVIGAWGGLLGWMKGKPVNDRFVTGPGYSWSDDAFAGFCVTYFLCGAVSGIYGSVILWLLSAFTNSPAKLAGSVGLMKGTIAAGICIIFAIDSTLLAWSTEIAYAFTLQLLGVVIMFFLCATQVSETNYFKEQDVIVPVAVMEKAPEDEVAKENEIHHQLEATASDEKISA